MSKDDKSSYYDAGDIETLDIIRAKLTQEQYVGFLPGPETLKKLLIGNALEYLCRANLKSDYTKWLAEAVISKPQKT